MRDEARRLLGLEPDGGAHIVALVGAGGKTSAMFAFAEALWAGRAIVTTTTRIRDPRAEPGRRFSGPLLDPALGRERSPGEGPPPSLRVNPLARSSRGPLVLAAGYEPAQRKLVGIHPSWAAPIAASLGPLLVEADGARGLPVKAPGDGEPVLPAETTLVIGLVGLSCLGKRAGSGTVHRPERFAAASGCAPGSPIEARHLAALVASPEGLFKHAPPGARRILLLNQEDAAPEGSAREVALALRAVGAGAIPVVAASIREGRLREAAPGGAA